MPVVIRMQMSLNGVRIIWTNMISLQVAPAIFENLQGVKFYLRYGHGSREEKLNFW